MDQKGKPGKHGMQNIGQSDSPADLESKHHHHGAYKVKILHIDKENGAETIQDTPSKVTKTIERLARYFDTSPAEIGNNLAAGIPYDTGFSIYKLTI